MAGTETPRKSRATGSERERVHAWQSKVRAADTAYREWAERFEVERGEDYYEGRQWYGVSEDQAKDKYVINLTLAAIETQKPALLFSKPQIRIDPRPARADEWNADAARAQAKLSQQAVQTFIDDPDVKFLTETSLAIHEAHFRFGIIEVGYTADSIDNPHAGKPLLPLKDGEEAPAGGPVQPDRVITPGSERLYVKRIPAKQFRVSLSDRNDLTANDWVGYYEWHYISDLKANRAYRKTDDLKATGTIDQKYRDLTTRGVETTQGMVKVWKIWDLRGHVKHVLAEGHPTFLQESVPWTALPFADLKFFERPDHYYPLPVVTNWIDPQDELNELRDTLRIHRRRFNRKYTAVKGWIDQEEMEKLERGGDGAWAWVNRDGGAPTPVQDAPLDASVFRQAIDTQNDFTMVSGVTAEQRSVSQADTATQASIMDQRARMRESSARMRVADWLGRIARLMLLALREHMALPFMIQTQVDPALATPEELMQAVQTWRAIQAKDLGDIDLDVSVELESLSPVSRDMKRITWNQVLALFSNPAILAMAMQSPTILRKTLSLYDITSEHEMQEIQKAAGAVFQMLQQGSKTGGMAVPNPGQALAGELPTPVTPPGGQAWAA